MHFWISYFLRCIYTESERERSCGREAFWCYVVSNNFKTPMQIVYSASRMNFRLRNIVVVTITSCHSIHISICELWICRATGDVTSALSSLTTNHIQSWVNLEVSHVYHTHVQRTLLSSIRFDSLARAQLIRSRTQRNGRHTYIVHGLHGRTILGRPSEQFKFV